MKTLRAIPPRGRRGYSRFSVSTACRRKTSTRLLNIQVGGTVLATLGALHFSAERVSKPLHPVANSENRHFQFQSPSDRTAGASLSYTELGPPDSTIPTGSCARISATAGRARKDRGKHLLLADAAGDQLRVLSTEIQHDDSVFRAHPASRFLRWCYSLAILRHYPSQMNRFSACFFFFFFFFLLTQHDIHQFLRDHDHPERFLYRRAAAQ